MKKLDLNDQNNEQIIEILKYGTGLKVNNVENEGIIDQIYVNDRGDNFFINATIFKPAPISSKSLPRTMTAPSAFISVYFDKQKNRVELGTTISDATFIPVKGSNMLGILKTPNGYMMTYGIGRSINNNSPIEFKNCNGFELAHLRFEWNPEDFKEEIAEADRGPDIKLDEKVNPIYTWTKRYFELLVDKKGHPKGFVHDSTTGKYLMVEQTDLSRFEDEFINRSENQAKEEEARRANEVVKLYELVPKEGE